MGRKITQRMLWPNFGRRKGFITLIIQGMSNMKIVDILQINQSEYRTLLYQNQIAGTNARLWRGASICLDCDGDAAVYTAIPMDKQPSESIFTDSIESFSFSDAEEIVPVVTKNEHGLLLMYAYTKKLAVDLTISKEKAAYWTTTRNKLWVKGEESGNELRVSSVSASNAFRHVYYEVKGNVPACHTNCATCFHRKLNGWPLFKMDPLKQKPEHELEWRIAEIDSDLAPV